MGKRGHSEEEILRVLREAEAGETVVEVCRKHGAGQQVKISNLLRLSFRGGSEGTTFLYHYRGRIERRTSRTAFIEYHIIY